MKIRWSPKAIADLQSIRNYIAQNNPSAAPQIAERILAATRRIGDFPLSGRVGRVEGTREMAVPGTPYLAVYRVFSETIEIIVVLHGHQNYPKQ